MPIHDWTRVEAGIFHHFHQAWISELAGTLNEGRLPPDFYALAEQFAGGKGPDVLTLQGPARGAAPETEPPSGIMLAEAPPQVQFHLKAEGDWYVAKANSVVVRHVSGHRVVAVLEIVSSGNKNSRRDLQQFVTKAIDLLKVGVHLLIVDLYPPGPRDPAGIHKLIWDEFIDNDFELPQGKPLTLAAYASATYPEAFVQPVSVGSVLPDMPLFLSADVYVPVPLETTYQSAWQKMPAYWREVLEARGEEGEARTI
jgi:hypothetical protein